ncbi:MAG: hypothetical protein ABI539_14760 [Acidobacteriota bacterium]
MKPSRRKKPKKISDAVFRGTTSAYHFEVYPLTTDLAEIPAVFIFSRRRTDKFKTGHHTTICIGETSSVGTELKKHKRAKCVKQQAADVVCICKESDPDTRLAVVEDLSGARIYSCIKSVYDTTIRPAFRDKIGKVKLLRRMAAARTAEPLKAAVSAKADPPGKKVKTTRMAAAVAAKSAVKGRRKAVRAKPEVASPAKPKKAAKKAQTINATAKTLRDVHRTLAADKRPTVTKQPARKRAAAPKKQVIKAAGKPQPANRKAALKVAAKPAKPAAAKRSGTPKPGTRIQGRVDSNGSKHRLSHAERSSGRRAKTRNIVESRTRKKAAA